jgi:hypothetical protein
MSHYQTALLLKGIFCSRIWQWTRRSEESKVVEGPCFRGGSAGLAAGESIDYAEMDRVGRF